MAIDTQQKRMSALFPMMPFRGIMGVPDGSGANTEGQRRLLLLLYSGVVTGAIPASTEIVLFDVDRLDLMTFNVNMLSLLTEDVGIIRTFTGDLER